MGTGARVAGAGTGRIAALLWFQGEADAMRREDALAYAWRMEAFVRDVRRDLAMRNLLVIQVRRYTTSMHGSPALTPLFSILNPVGIATAQNQGKWLDLVRKEQRAVRVPNLNDVTHLTTQAQVRLGKMLADAYIVTL
uniref:Sialate O-acetylesterase domain-containing protein n=1 Tax=Aegilops tauschii TaxID=37682 RepID=M8BHP7_AEGTA